MRMDMATVILIHMSTVIRTGTVIRMAITIITMAMATAIRTIMATMDIATTARARNSDPRRGLRDIIETAGSRLR